MIVALLDLHVPITPTAAASGSSSFVRRTCSYDVEPVLSLDEFDELAKCDVGGGGGDVGPESFFDELSNVELPIEDRNSFSSG